MITLERAACPRLARILIGGIHIYVDGGEALPGGAINTTLGGMTR